MIVDKTLHRLKDQAIVLVWAIPLAIVMIKGKAEAEVTEGKNIIDIHCHTAGIGAGNSGCFISTAMRKSYKTWFFLKAFGVTEAELEKEGDGLILRRLSESLAQSERVAKAVILALDGVVDELGELDATATEIYIPNEFLARETRRYANLLFGASINPYRHDALDRLERAAADGAVLVKWLPSIQHIDPADERLIPFYMKLKELNLPLLSHTGSEHSFTRAQDELADPERLRLPLSLGVTVIAAHAGGEGRNQGEKNIERFIRLTALFPRLYGDISALTQLNHLGHLPRLMNNPELADRLCYGSDMPLLNTPIVSAWGFLFRIPLAKILEINRIENPWDQDVALKEALGVTRELLKNSGRLLRRIHCRLPAGEEEGKRPQI